MEQGIGASGEGAMVTRSVWMPEVTLLVIPATRGAAMDGRALRSEEGGIHFAFEEEAKWIPGSVRHEAANGPGQIRLERI